MITGLIPAGGSGCRWGGHIKELLPLGKGKWMLDNCIHTLASMGASKFVIISNTDKISAITNHMKKFPEYNVSYVMGCPEGEMWDSMKKGMEAITGDSEDKVLMMMPDTIVEVESVKFSDYNNFLIGTFNTEMPERFSIIVDNKILTKPQDLKGKGTFKAWGITGWNLGLQAKWLASPEINHFDRAFEMGLNGYSVQRVQINKYHDMASFDDYQRYLMVQ